MIRVTIGIKVLNEEARIATCIESALAAIRTEDGEVIVADSGSTDRTIEIARQYPIRIVQLANPSERSCGAGAQLAFQFAQGEYFCLLDGDMVLSSGFVGAGIDFLMAHDDCAGVGGSIREVNLDNADFRIRAKCLESNRGRKPGFVDRLDGGGVYRSSAIRETGYFADRNLHGSEESELALRLRNRGWKLARIDLPAAEHFGYQMGGYALMWRRIRSGYAAAFGEVMRACWRNRQFVDLLKNHEHVRCCLAVVFWWVLICTVAAISPRTVALLLIVPIGYLSVRRRSVNLGIYSYLTWNVFAAGMIWGLMRKRISPGLPLAVVELQPQPETHRDPPPTNPPSPSSLIAQSDWPEGEYSVR